MAKYLLDSDVIIEWLRGNPRVVQWLAARDVAGDFLACTPVTVAKIYAGLRPHDEFIVGDLLRVVHCIDLNARIGHKAGRYRQAFAARTASRSPTHSSLPPPMSTALPCARSTSVTTRCGT